MLDNTAHNLNNGDTQLPQTSSSGNAAQKTVPEIIQNFRATFKLMSKELRWGGVEDVNGDTRDLGDSDIKGYIRDIKKFSNYIEEWESKKTDLSENITSVQGLQQSIEEIVTQLRIALRVEDRLKPQNLDIEQFDKGSNAYFTRLRECGRLIEDMLKVCFV